MKVLLLGLASLLLLAGCCGGRDDTEPPQPVSPGTPVAPAVPPTPAVAGCAGASQDPPAAMMATSEDMNASYVRLAPLLPQYPNSATLRVLTAGAALHSTPHNTAEAQRLYAEARTLHNGGCRLAPQYEWAMLEGMGLGHMFDSNWAASVPPLTEATQRFPNAASSHYNLACAYCRSGNVNACHQEFVTTLEVTAAGRFEPWRTAPARTVGHYVRLSGVDPDMEALRADPRYPAAIAPYQGQP